MGSQTTLSHWRGPQAPSRLCSFWRELVSNCCIQRLVLGRSSMKSFKPHVFGHKTFLFLCLLNGCFSIDTALVSAVCRACPGNQDDGNLKVQGFLRIKHSIFMLKNEESHVSVFLECGALMNTFLVLYQISACPQCQHPVPCW